MLRTGFGDGFFKHRKFGKHLDSKEEHIKFCLQWTSLLKSRDERNV